MVEIRHERLGSSRLDLAYVSVPEGRWSGTMYSFAQFGDNNLDAWRADPSASAAHVGNAFIKQWATFRSGRMTLDDFRAILTATIEKTWDTASVKALEGCDDPPGGGEGGGPRCFLSEQGRGTYSSAIATFPIPTGLTELPIAMNLRPAGGDNQLAGRIETGETLHYGGDPRVELALDVDPSAPGGDSCSVRVNACLNYVTGFAADVLVGGRYRTTADDGECSTAPADDFALTRTPWLVPGFLGGTEVDPASGVRYAYECRDETLPYGEGAEALNSSFAAANPVPDGQTRRRHLELVGGRAVRRRTRPCRTPARPTPGRRTSGPTAAPVPAPSTRSAATGCGVSTTSAWRARPARRRGAPASTTPATRR